MKIFFLLLLAGAALLLFYTVMKAKNYAAKDHSNAETDVVEFHDQQLDQYFTLSYRGYRMIGEKHIQPKEDSIEVTKVVMTAAQPTRLTGFCRNDLYRMEECILQHFPYASIEWRHPINELVLTEI
jgi:hypothetical protein